MKSKQGVTLTEVIVSLGIFTLVIAGGLSGVRRGFDILRDSRDYTRISQILQSEVETLRTLSWVELVALPSSVKVAVDTQFDTSAYDMYQVTRRIENEEEGLRRVVVTVSYENRRGGDVTLEYVTFFAEGGVNDYYYRTI
ncbi:prepilin-type N-terminal cleavage/methylation domain-containing protein [Coraliomargarita sp. SDUM461003]|uniref:Prepilin-type N-terminal cleavage/methylation domain-containing protein n=1 Tax=Thalassobacterium maritimum TaxID=3041265 RepID=A0ABU1ATA3_9BACT|nr:prepilin-type N-terminal cleavage/methylation domain-containing protein [Coraliomargarita sp. SDUM461003]MDQ8207402.1 prepilin-type N-terminal cleavage/methylation domain-containing protein [Coraliomargarita sp. SDUM461003]